MILCLHGYVQNKDIMNKKMCKILGNAYKDRLLCPNGPKRVKITNDDGTEKEGYGWWSINNKDLIEKPTQSQIDACLKYGRELIAKWEIENPKQSIDYAIGFSQGASCVTLWIQEGIIKPKKVILISNFSLLGYIHTIFDIPSMHIFGDNDDLLWNNFDRNKIEEWSLVKWYKNPTIIFHKWGHVIPSTSKYKKLIRSFCDL